MGGSILLIPLITMLSTYAQNMEPSMMAQYKDQQKLVLMETGSKFQPIWFIDPAFVNHLHKQPAVHPIAQ